MGIVYFLYKGKHKSFKNEKCRKVVTKVKIDCIKIFSNTCLEKVVLELNLNVTFYSSNFTLSFNFFLSNTSYIYNFILNLSYFTKTVFFTKKILFE